MLKFSSVFVRLHGQYKPCSVSCWYSVNGDAIRDSQLCDCVGEIVINVKSPIFEFELELCL